MRTLITGVAAALFAVLAGADAKAQDGTDRNQAINAETARLQAETARLQAETALWNARLGALPEGKQGTISIGTGSAYAIGARARVYRQVDLLAERLCTKLCNQAANDPGAMIVLVGHHDAAAPTRHYIAKGHLDLLTKEVETFLDIKPIGAKSTTSIGAALTAAISVVELFRTDRKIFPETSSIPPAYLQNKVAQCLDQNRLRYPAVEAGDALLFPDSSAFVKGVDTLVRHRDALKTATQSTDAKKKAEAEKLLERVNTFVGEVLTTQKGETLPPLVAILHGEAISNSLHETPAPYVVLVDLVEQGGISVISSKIWRSDRLLVGGGAIATYRITQAGRLVASGAESLVDPALKRVALGDEASDQDPQ